MEEKDKISPVFDWETGEFAVDMAGQLTTVAGPNAIPQIIAKAQRTARGLYAIYADLENTDFNHKYGSDVFAIIANKELDDDSKVSELKRAIKEAIAYDPWIAEVYTITVTKTGVDLYEASYQVRTIFNDILEVEGVLFNG